MHCRYFMLKHFKQSSIASPDSPYYLVHLVVGPVSFKVIEDFSSSVDVPFIKGLGISRK
jgi:hypothetical protein